MGDHDDDFMTKHTHRGSTTKKVTFTNLMKQRQHMIAFFTDQGIAYIAFGEKLLVTYKDIVVTMH